MAEHDRNLNDDSDDSNETDTEIMVHGYSSSAEQKGMTNTSFINQYFLSGLYTNTSILSGRSLCKWSDEVLPCKPCEENGTDSEGEYFCCQCRTYFCNVCKGHHQEENGLHTLRNVINPETAANKTNASTDYSLCLFEMAPDRPLAQDTAPESSQSQNADYSSQIPLKFKGVVNIQNTYKCAVKSVLILSKQIFVLAEQESHRLKLLEVALPYHKVLVVIEFDNSPGDFSRFDDNSFVVTFPDEQVIRFVEYTEDEIYVSRAVDLYDDWFGIDASDGKLYVAFPSKMHIATLNKSGMLLQTISTSFGTEGLRPDRIAVHGSSLFFIDYTRMCIYKAKKAGNETHLIRSLKLSTIGSAEGFAMLENGDLLVSFPSANKICFVSAETLEIYYTCGPESSVFRPNCMCVIGTNLAVVQYYNVKSTKTH